MIARIIAWSIYNRVMVLVLALMLGGWGAYSARTLPLDAIPDLSDVQVIVKTSFPGQAPQVIENQITYPLATAMLSVPGATTVRGYSFFGDSYIYVIFKDGTDPYWARSRVLEYLSQVSGRLPPGVQPKLGPDATGVGWVYQYALVDRTGKHDLAQLRSLQDWFMKYELQTVPGVAEVATVGGMVKQYQIVLDPTLMRSFVISLDKMKKSIQAENRDTGGSSIEIAEAEYRIYSHGLITGEKDIRNLHYLDKPIRFRRAPATLAELADIRVGPQMREGVAELNGQGEAVGGIVVMRGGENALVTIARIKEKLATMAKGLPEGVEIVPVYDRSSLILRAVDNLRDRLVEEFFAVTLVCLIFLLHFRSSLVIVVSLCVGILSAIAIMRFQGINANIMSLGGIAIAIGAMVDAAIVMIENAHKHLERNPDINRLEAIRAASVEVGGPLFFSLMIITLSFIPVFTLQAQEGRLFGPLAYTKTYAMAAAAMLSITLVPALMAYFIRGKIRSEARNPISSGLIRLYQPIIGFALDHFVFTLLLVAALVASAALPLSKLGSEFMPDLDEGDLLYMPSTLPGISIGKAKQLLQQTDKLIATVPEVASVFGKVGRADTATDPAPLTMMETTIQLKPKSQWRTGMTMDGIKKELDERVHLPGLTNAWLMPIRARLDMLATGIRTPVGIKIAGPDLNVIEDIGKQVEAVVGQVSGTTSVFSERIGSARYIDIAIDRNAAARYWVSVDEIQDVINTAVGGMNVAETYEGRERYPINLRYPVEYRNSVDSLKSLPIVTDRGYQVQLGDVADIRIKDGPEMIRSENARPNGWVYVDIRDRDLGSYVHEAQQRVAQQVKLPPSYTLSWSGQYEYLERAQQRLMLIGPLVGCLIFLLLYLNFRNLVEPLMVMLALPLALVGGVWLLQLLHYNFSVAVGVGFIALAGVAAEFGIVMLVYLDQAVAQHKPATRAALREAVLEGAVQRVRPKAMTVAVILAGLLPMMFGQGTGSEVMRRIAAPMLGGMVTAPLVSMVVLPICYYLWKRASLPKQ
ncbi:MAG: CusA/CzcA family heavy metal efflux RND transporter [Thiobacillaceae bacterium]